MTRARGPGLVALVAMTVASMTLSACGASGGAADSPPLTATSPGSETSTPTTAPASPSPAAEP
ncbi:MAG TPA: cytochrome-c peroxidase, partial [Actinomycetota bacterium]|nr:cytochrome-c peroxidase [Actinomycetota bacterium]